MAANKISYNLTVWTSVELNRRGGWQCFKRNIAEFLFEDEQERPCHRETRDNGHEVIELACCQITDDQGLTAASFISSDVVASLRLRSIIAAILLNKLHATKPGVYLTIHRKSHVQ